jgi:hypothetical protein
MAGFTRVNGAGFSSVATLYATGQHKAYVVVIKDDSNTAIDLRSDDGVVEGKLEQFLREVSPLMYYAVNDNSGTVYMILDGHHNDAASLQDRVRQIFGATAAANDSTVTLGTAITVS